ncbi:class F sortase [Mangrovihabitans endophyticus]|uniref:Sortase family protein n=1 Tax=Mangrovihabitans endophyticus TaxID=1751298 RepID=A0A8J3C380_9ACTN|nr:class F sortase [Mangrovihabitans endophyticus]GGL02783.1 hypothetical protein GCM10012284_41740 [Mangrovihabitans endophyticus]
MTGPRMPESVLRRRPAQTAPRPRGATGARPQAPARRPGATGAPSRAPARRPGARPPRPRLVIEIDRGPLKLVAAVLVVVGLFAVAAGLGNATRFDLADLFRGPDEPPPRAFPVLDPSAPVRLAIPAIKVEAPVLAVGLARDGSVDVPPLNRHNEAGWYRGGPTPGQFGPALIVGHADTRTGPSIFHRLRAMKPGQLIEVQREDRETAVFEVNSVEHFGKSALPVQRVYGDYSRPSLRLMTCGGTWLGGAQGYSDNVVVFASLIGTKDDLVGAAGGSGRLGDQLRLR